MKGEAGVQMRSADVTTLKTTELFVAAAGKNLPPPQRNTFVRIDY